MQTRRAVIRGAGAIALGAVAPQPTAADSLGTESDPIGTYWLGGMSEAAANSLARMSICAAKLDGGETYECSVGVRSDVDLEIYESAIIPLDGQGEGKIEVKLDGSKFHDGTNDGKFTSASPLASHSPEGQVTITVKNTASSTAKTPKVQLSLRGAR